MKWKVALFLSICALPVRAQEDETPFPESRHFNDPLGLGVRNMQYFLGAKIEEWFDDNILLSGGSTESDLITVLIPDLKLSFEKNKNIASLKYRGRELLYADHSEFNGMEHFLELLARIQVSRVTFEVGDNLKNRKDPFDTLQENARLDTSDNRFWFTTIIDWTKFDLEFTYAVQKFDIQDSAFDFGDYRRNEFSILAGTDIMPKTTGFLELRFTNTQYRLGVLSDFDTIRAVFGLKGEISPKIAVNGRIGFTRAQVDQNGTTPASNFSGLVLSAAATWLITDEGTIKAELVRQPLESVISGLAIDTGINADYEHRFTDRITGTGGFGWEKQEESSASDDRNMWNIHAGAKYLIGDHVTLDAWLQFRTKSSDDGRFDYDNFRGYIGVAANW